MDKKYDAFISYRHSELDMYVAKTIERKLETFKLPKGLEKKANRPKIERVFRDQDELPIASDLNEQIMSALEVTDYLIVICTPRLPESSWCISEITNFKRMHGKDRILAVLAEGEPEDSFPEELLIDEKEHINDKGEKVIEKVKIEPLAADVRGKNKREINKKIDDAIMRLAAAIFGVEYDDLKQRHKEREMKANMAKMTIAASVFMAFAVVSTIFMINLAGKNREITTQNTLISSQKNEIESQKEEIEKQYKEVQKNYIATMATTSNELIKKGRKKDALYALLSVIPETSDDEFYSTECHRILNECLNVNAPNNDFVITGSIDMESPVIEVKISTDGEYIVLSNQSNSLLVIDAETTEIVDSVEYLSGTKFGFIDEKHFYFTGTRDDFSYGAGKIYSLEDNTITDLGINSIIGGAGNNNGQYIIYTGSEIAVFNEGEYEAIAKYNRYDQSINIGEGTISEVSYINDTDILIASRVNNEINVVIFDTANGELKMETNIDSDISLCKALYSEGKIYLVTSKETMYLDRNSDCHIICIDEKGKIVKENAIEKLPIKEISFNDKYGLVFTNKEKIEVVDRDSLELRPELEFMYQNATDIIETRIVAGTNRIFITYKNGTFQSYTIGNFGQMDYGYIVPKFNKDVNASVISNNVLVQILKGESNLIIMKQNQNPDIESPEYNYSAIISPNGKYTLVKEQVNGKSVIRVRENANNSILHEINETGTAGFIGDGDTFFISGDTCAVYDVISNNKLFEIEPEDNRPFNKLYKNVVVYKKIDSSTKYYIYSLEDGSLIYTIDTDFEMEKDSNADFEVSENGDYYALYDQRNEIRVYRMGEDIPFDTIPIKYKLVKDICFSTDSKYIAVGYIDNKVEFYNLEDLSLEATIYNIDININTIYLEYLEGLNRYMLSCSMTSYIINENMEIEDNLSLVSSYGKGEGYLSYNMYGYSIMPYVSYEDLVKEAKEYLGDYVPGEEIKKRYHIVN